jgi:hypothetical protein
MIGNLKSTRATFPCLGAVVGSGNQSPTQNMSPSTLNYAYLDATDCLPVTSVATTTANSRTQLSLYGYNGGFQTGMWQLAADCTTLSASWLNIDGTTTVPVLPFYDASVGFTGLFGSKTAFQATFPGETVQDATLQLTPQGYVKVTRAGIADTYYLAETFSTYIRLTTDTTQARVFTFTTSV